MGGRKHATKISHVESFALSPDELAGELQRKFQVEPTSSKMTAFMRCGKTFIGEALQKIVHSFNHPE